MYLLIITRIKKIYFRPSSLEQFFFISFVMVEFMKQWSSTLFCDGRIHKAVVFNFFVMDCLIGQASSSWIKEDETHFLDREFWALKILKKKKMIADFVGEIPGFGLCYCALISNSSIHILCYAFVNEHYFHTFW